MKLNLLKQSQYLLLGDFVTFIFFFMLYATSCYNGIYYYRECFCLADAYLWFLMPINYGMLVSPILLVTFLCFEKKLERIQVVISLQTMKKWVNLNIKIILLLSFVVAIITMVTITFFTILQVRYVLNWSKSQSVYYIITNHTNFAIHIEEVIIFIMIVMFLRNVVLCLGTFFIKVLTNNSIVALLIMISIAALESFSHHTHLLYRFLTLDYDIFDQPRKSLLCIVYCIVLIPVLYFLIKHFSECKEWIHGKKK